MRIVAETQIKTFLHKREIIHMPLAVTHVLLTIIAVDLYRDYVAKHRRYFTLWTLFVAGFGGLLPDLDIPLSLALTKLGINIPGLSHGTFMHTPFFGLIFLIPFSVLWIMKEHKLAILFLVVAFGVFFHIFLDYMLGGGDIQGIMALYPLSSEQFRGPYFAIQKDLPLREGIDAIILLLWLFHEERRHKIRDFI
jgi:membrane-bound metal-dependent hydrolase YbcI (DUF457 family)